MKTLKTCLSFHACKGTISAVICLRFETPKTINFPFGTNGKLIVLGVPIHVYKDITVLISNMWLNNLLMLYMAGNVCNEYRNKKLSEIYLIWDMWSFQQAHCIVMTSYWRRCDVKTSSRRHVPARFNPQRIHETLGGNSLPFIAGTKWSQFFHDQILF